MDVKFFHLFVTFPFLSAVSGISSQDSICNSAFSCGNITDLSYPFWSDTRPYYCGHKAFKLKNCEGNRVHPTLEIGALNYRVIGINSSSQTLRIARLDLSENICPDRFVNTTIDPSLFSYTPKDVNATLLYNCSSLPSNSYPDRFSCDEREGFMAVALRLAPICDARVEIPVLSEAVGGGGFNETVGVSEVLNRGFDVRWRVEEEFCRDCVLSGGICGYNTSLSQPQCVCPDRSTSVGICGPETRSRRDTIPKIVIATGSAALALLLVAFLKICHSRRRSCKRRLLFWQKRSVDEQNIQAFIKSLGFIATERWTYAQIKQMTNSFHNKLGQGGYGSVFKGKLPNGRAVAVKLLGTSKGSGEEFINEVASISRTSHVNIVSLVGFCFEGCKRALIYEFMPNGSLEKFIYNDNPPEPSQNLGWEKLYQIAVGIARGLEYLHQGCSTRILHFDIKPHNILLDEDFCPKISDFGLSKLSCRKQSMVSMMDARGTIGYIAPEVFSRNFGQVSHKSDVYSYGMMVLEMVGGRKNLNPKVDNTSEIYFPHWIYRRVELNEDLGLQGNGTKEESELARKMILVGLWCIQNDPSLRPGMSEVLEMLSGSLEAIKIPPKPFVSSSPPRPDPGSSSIVSISLQ